MLKNKQGGSVANKNGNILEEFVENVLVKENYSLVNKTKFLESCDSRKIYTRQMRIAETIYGTAWNSDFVLFNPGSMFPYLIIECKWQQSGGSVDEKFPYLVYNIKEKSPYPAIVLLDGKGYKPKAEEWLKSQVDEKLIGVFDMGGFRKWVNLGNL